MRDKPRKGKIESWSVQPFAYGYAIHGVDEDGRMVRTSRIVKLDEHEVETENSIYQLGHRVGHLPSEFK